MTRGDGREKAEVSCGFGFWKKDIKGKSNVVSSFLIFVFFACFERRQRRRHSALNGGATWALGVGQGTAGGGRRRQTRCIGWAWVVEEGEKVWRLGRG